MNVFHCDHCDQLVFFENTHCLKCERLLSYLPDVGEVDSIDEQPDGSFTSPEPLAAGRSYRHCANRLQHNICNWAVEADDPNPLCRSCRFTTVIPDLSVPGNLPAWANLEAAKRRLLHALMRLGCPLVPKAEGIEGGLAFEFKGDPADPTEPRVLTGHADGVITVNIIEADDAERERMRAAMHEPYRTLLGHFRHEIGHYYWDVLIARGRHLDECRTLFGDERQDYGEAVKTHYETGAPADWQQSYISSYATMHPWEDWAETWAHYLHMQDTLETAAACGVSIKPKRRDQPTAAIMKPVEEQSRKGFEKSMESWLPLTYLLNNLNRGLGRPDAYPFVLSAPAVKKLAFVHKVLQGLAS